MAARTMLTLAASTGSKDEIPTPILTMLRQCASDNPADRPRDVLEHFNDFLTLRTSIYGTPKWVDFNLPGGPVEL
jgi:hypothetical protein